MKVKLNKLGGTDWQKTRSKVKAAVKDIAKDLIALYSRRMNTKGYAFSPDIDMQTILNDVLNLRKPTISCGVSTK